MENKSLPKLEKIIQDLLINLKEREQNIIIRRFGLDGEKQETLESLGKKMNLTRERIRQIEKRAIEKIIQKEVIKEKYPEIIDLLNQAIKNYGHLVEEETLINEISKILNQENNKPFANEIKFLLKISNFTLIKKTDKIRNSWTNSNLFNQKLLEEINKELASILEKKKTILNQEEFYNEFSKTKFYQEYKNKLKISKILFFSLSKCMKELMKVRNKNNYWGLVSWPEINPKTIHEWTYYVLKNYGKPIHFTKISDLIKKEKAKKKFNIKTIHNVLISDSRFVLVGNGLYALREWGYESGTVADVILRILKREKRPLTTQEIIERVLQERIVKKNTILVNLQNRKLFKKIARATYQLAGDN